MKRREYYRAPAEFRPAKYVFAACALVLILTASISAQTPVATYNFDEGSGTTALDSSGSGNNATISGADYVPLNIGYGLRFDSYLDVVTGPSTSSLDIRDNITVEAWVSPDTGAMTSGEPYIVGKSYGSFLLTYYPAGKSFWWYVSGSGNHCAVAASSGWTHLAGTFDGTIMKLYSNGELASSWSYTGAIGAGSALYIGPGSTGFRGMIDGVKIYHGALSQATIRQHYNDELQSKLERFSPVTNGVTLTDPNWSFKVGCGGGMELDIGTYAYGLESSFSYSGSKIGWNQFTEGDKTGSLWTVSLVQDGANKARLMGVYGSVYTIARDVSLQGGRVKVVDTFTNNSSQNVGIIVQNRLVSPTAFKECLLGGVPDVAVYDSGANPTVYASQTQTAVGVVAESDMLRARFQASHSSNRSTFGTEHFAVPPGQSRTQEWSIYPLAGVPDYFTMINSIRKDWLTNFMVDGPSEFTYIYRSSYPADTAGIQAQFDRKPTKLLLCTPFLEYPSENKMTRDQYKAYAIETETALKAAVPGVKIYGCIEASLAPLNTDQIPGGDQVQAYIDSYTGPIYGPLPANLSAIVDNANLPWDDSYVRTADGRIQMEIYKDTQNTQSALMVYPAIGNGQYTRLMDQVKFLLEDAGLDGVYFDTFGFGNDYSKWDGFSADINTSTGAITQLFNDTNVLACEARQKVALYALPLGKRLVQNGGNSIGQTDQGSPIFRVMETDLVPFNFGTEPPVSFRISNGQLGSPVALMGAWNTTDEIFKCVITYLRHGLLTYFYNTNLRSYAQYGPFKHMFPITPIALHKGWVEGKERIFTCLSGTYTWPKLSKPSVHVFDRAGNEISPQVTFTRGVGNWTVQLTLADWEQTGVIED